MFLGKLALVAALLAANAYGYSVKISHAEDYHPVRSVRMVMDEDALARRDQATKASQPFPDEVTLEFSAMSQDFSFKLTINRDLIANGAKIHTHDPLTGRLVSSDMPRLTYSGLDANGNSATATLREDGAFHALIRTVDADDIVNTIQIEPKDHVSDRLTLRKRNLLANSDMVAFFPTSEGHTCAVDVEHRLDLPRNMPLDYAHQKAKRSLAAASAGGFSDVTLRRKSEFPGLLEVHRRDIGPGGPAPLFTGCYTQESTNVKYAIQVAFAVDDGFLRVFGNDQTKARAYVQSIVNNANDIYSNNLNIVWQLNQILFANGKSYSWNKDRVGRSDCGGSTSYTINDHLNDLTSWRSSLGAIGQDPLNIAGQWHVLTDCYPPPGTVGLAWVATLCDSGGHNTGVSTYSDTTWKTTAHEVGHNHGGNHAFEQGQGTTGGIMDYGDGTYQGKYMFHPVYNQKEVCAEIQNAFNGANGKYSNCFTTFKAVCGNGIVEPGEQCDDTSSCCNQQTCQFSSGAVCSAGDCCDTTTCSFKSAATICNGNGYCAANGRCQDSMCTAYSNTNYCGDFASTCHQGCTMTGNSQCLGASDLSGLAGKDQILDGSICGNGMVCQSGACVAGGQTVPSPTPSPSYIAQSPYTKPSSTPQASASKSPSAHPKPSSTSSPSAAPSRAPGASASSSPSNAPAPSASSSASPSAEAVAPTASTKVTLSIPTSIPLNTAFTVTIAINKVATGTFSIYTDDGYGDVQQIYSIAGTGSASVKFQGLTSALQIILYGAFVDSTGTEYDSPEVTVSFGASSGTSNVAAAPAADVADVATSNPPSVSGGWVLLPVSACYGICQNGAPVNGTQQFLAYCPTGTTCDASLEPTGNDLIGTCTPPAFACKPFWGLIFDNPWLDCSDRCLEQSNIGCYHPNDTSGSNNTLVEDTTACALIVPPVLESRRCAVLGSPANNTHHWVDSNTLGDVQGACGAQYAYSQYICIEIASGLRVQNEICLGLDLECDPYVSRQITANCTNNNYVVFKAPVSNSGSTGASAVSIGLIVGVAIGGAAFVAIIVGAAVYVVNRRRFASKESSGFEKSKATQSYDGLAPGELTIKSGDIIVIKSRNGDMLEGRNERTGREGRFPASIVNQVDTSNLVLVAR